MEIGNGFHAKVEAGAHFAMTQGRLFEIGKPWYSFVEKKNFGGTATIPVLIGVWPPDSYNRRCEYKPNAVPPYHDPQPILKSWKESWELRRRVIAASNVARNIVQWGGATGAGLAAYLEFRPSKRTTEFWEIFCSFDALA